MTTPTYRALLVANSTFPDDAVNLPDLEGPRNDAALLRDAICDREYGLFTGDNVRLVQERRMSDVLREIEDFLRSASRDDTLLLYYSGHGVLDQSSEFFLCAQDSRTDRLRSTAIKASDVSEMIGESAARTTMIVLDCCHSGRFKGGDVTTRLAGEGRFVLTSSRSTELARDALAPNRASVFTNHLVQGLLGQARDHDDDGVVNLSEVYDYVLDVMRQSGSQVPQKRFEGSGDVPEYALRPTPLGAPTADVLDPAQAPPVLNVSTTEIDLGRIEHGESLPPERILVINRGGGALDWTVRASDPWVTPVADHHGIDLHLAPPNVGVNRANVYVTDEITGHLETVRIRVVVSPASRSFTPLAEGLPTPPRPVEAAAPSPVETDAPPPVETDAPPAVETAEPAPVETAEPTMPAWMAPGRPDRTEPDPREDHDLGAVGPLATPVPPAPAPTTEPVLPWSPEPDVAVGTPADEPSATEPEVATHRPRDWPRRLALVAGITAAAGGTLTALTAWWVASEAYDSDSSKDLWWRGGWGPGVNESLIAGALLTVVACTVLSERRRPAAVAAVAVGAITTAAVRLAEGGQLSEDWTWLDSWGTFGFPVLLLLLAGASAIAAIVAFWGRHAVERRRRLGRRGGVVVVAAGVWAIGLGVDLYYSHLSDERFGDHLGERRAGESWQLLAAVLVVGAVVAALTVLRTPVAKGALVGAVIVPIASAASEVGFTLKWGEYIDWGWEVVVFALAATVLAVTALRIAARGFGSRIPVASDQ